MVSMIASLVTFLAGCVTAALWIAFLSWLGVAPPHNGALAGGLLFVGFVPGYLLALRVFGAKGA